MKKIFFFTIGTTTLYIFFNLYNEHTLRFNQVVKSEDFKKFLVNKYQKYYDYSNPESKLYVNQLYKNNEIHGLDLNNDGVLEIEVGGAYNCYDTSCSGEYYLKTDRGYKLILDGVSIVALDTYTNNFRDLRYQPNDIGECTTFGLNCNKLSKYKYNGNVYKIDVRKNYNRDKR